jgi:predicted transcriptional regulator of viral defense system
MTKSLEHTARRLARRHALLRTHDFEAAGVPRRRLPALVAAGLWEKSGHGLYRSALRPPGPHHALLEAARRTPSAVICLLSALRFHELTTETPAEVWAALPRTARPPRSPAVPLQVVRLSPASYADGVEEHRIEGQPVRVYSAAKTVADCFKFRNRVGVDVALEALRDAWRRRKATAEALWRHARTARVANVMRPYLEAVLR